MFFDELKRGIIKENPIVVLALGLCPALAISTSVLNGLAMGIAATFVLACSNLIVSLVRQAIPSKVRIPCYIIIIATFVTILQLLMKAYFLSFYKSLGIFVPLIAVNCIILGRAEAFASKNKPFSSVVDGLVMGAGFTISLFILSAMREILGSNKLFGLNVIPGFQPMSVFVLAPGGFLTIAFVMGLVRFYENKKRIRS